MNKSSTKKDFLSELPDAKEHLSFLFEARADEETSVRLLNAWYKDHGDKVEEIIPTLDQKIFYRLGHLTAKWLLEVKLRHPRLLFPFEEALEQLTWRRVSSGELFEYTSACMKSMDVEQTRKQVTRLSDAWEDEDHPFYKFNPQKMASLLDWAFECLRQGKTNERELADVISGVPLVLLARMRPFSLLEQVVKTENLFQRLEEGKMPPCLKVLEDDFSNLFKLPSFSQRRQKLWMSNPLLMCELQDQTSSLHMMARPYMVATGFMKLNTEKELSAFGNWLKNQELSFQREFVSRLVLAHMWGGPRCPPQDTELHNRLNILGSVTPLKDISLETTVSLAVCPWMFHNKKRTHEHTCLLIRQFELSAPLLHPSFASFFHVLGHSIGIDIPKPSNYTDFSCKVDVDMAELAGIRSFLSLKERLILLDEVSPTNNPPTKKM